MPGPCVDLPRDLKAVHSPCSSLAHVVAPGNTKPATCLGGGGHSVVSLKALRGAVRGAERFPRLKYNQVLRIEHKQDKMVPGTSVNLIRSASTGFLSN